MNNKNEEALAQIRQVIECKHAEIDTIEWDEQYPKDPFEKMEIKGLYGFPVFVDGERIPGKLIIRIEARFYTGIETMLPSQKIERKDFSHLRRLI